MLQWKDDFNTGIASIDFEHQELIRVINETLVVMAGLGTDDDRDKLVEGLGDIHNLAAAHFALEETEMRQLGYPKLSEHKSDHESLLDDILNLIETVDKNHKSGTLQELETRLSNWFSVHFRTHDADFHVVTKGNEIG